MSVDDSVETVKTEGSPPVDSPQDVKDQGTGSEADADQGEAPEVEVVLSGDAGSLPKDAVNRIVQKRIGRLNARNSASQEQASDLAAENAMLRESDKLHKIALAQLREQNEASNRPDPDDYEGVSDPKYRVALDKYDDARVDARIQRQNTQLARDAPAPQADPEVKRALQAHYERAGKLRVKDYEEAEGKAIDILGSDNANYIVQVFENSELLLYHLGRNPSKAEEIAELAKSNPVDSIKAVAKLGQLSASLTVKPRAQSDPAPDPDKGLVGGMTPSNSAYDKKLDKLRESGDIKAIMEFKRAQKAKAGAAA